MRSLIFSWTSKEKDYQGVLTRTSGQDVSPIRRWLYFWRVLMGEKVFLKHSWWNGNGTNRIAARCQNEKKEETKDFLSVCSYLLPILDISLFSQVSLTPFLNCPHWTELVSLEGDFLPPQRVPSGWSQFLLGVFSSMEETLTSLHPSPLYWIRNLNKFLFSPFICFVDRQK